MLKLAVIVPTFEHLGFARDAIQSLVATTKDFRALLIDDGSKEWKDQDWTKWPSDLVMEKYRYEKNGGLTRSWNQGLRIARDWGAEYACCANSDILFTPGWFEAINWALLHGVDLAGPLTNAPGHQPKQHVQRHIADYKLTDERGYLAEVAKRLAEKNRKQFVPMRVNGFCLVAKTSTWWANSYDEQNVFHPKHKMTRNEDELQGRWKKAGRVSAVVTASFVFHFRGVSRKGATKGRAGSGWFRRSKKK